MKLKLIKESHYRIHSDITKIIESLEYKNEDFICSDCLTTIKDLEEILEEYCYEIVEIESLKLRMIQK